MTVATTTGQDAPRSVVIERKGRPAMVVYVFGRYVRLAHWIRNGVLIWMALSGIYLGNPFLARLGMGQATESFVMAQVRGWHVAAGWVLLAFTLARIYQFLFITERGRLGIGHELRMGRILFNWRAWRDQLAFLFLRRRDHPHVPYSNYGPLQYLVYTMLYASLLVISVTGFVMWWFVFFTVVHVYMAVWNSMRSGNLLIEGIISGLKAETTDIREHAPKTGKGKA